ncbi:MAG: hypothetical protein JXX14_25690 [Deltaproteobacteria bacterium]|nr:hypothetical protein [Deltaproteobacteria bacterium]
MCVVGMPFFHTQCAMILVHKLLSVPADIVTAKDALLHGIGLAGGLAEMLSDGMQTQVGAAAVRCLSDGGKGIAFLIIAMGILETVGIIARAFLYIAVSA